MISSQCLNADLTNPIQTLQNKSFVSESQGKFPIHTEMINITSVVIRVISSLTRHQQATNKKSITNLMPKTLNKDGVTISFSNVANITRISNPSQCQSHSESELRLTASKTSDFEYMLYVHIL